MPTDYKKEWMEKSSIDYFSPFISLWLACNSWYLYHYSDLTGGDRVFIDTLKSDPSGRNHLYRRFCELIEKNDKSGIAFRTNIELLHYSLDRAQLTSKKIGPCSFNLAVIDYHDITNKTDLIIRPKINQDGKVHADDAPSVIQLDKIFITSNKNIFYAGLFEIIYQIRNMLVHGNLNPGKEEHEIVKYCYLILWDLMN